MADSKVLSAHAKITEKVTATEGPVCLVVASPWGDIVVRGDNKNIRSIRFQPGQTNKNTEQAGWVDDCIRQLQNYCDGKLKQFYLPLAPIGTEFQQQVWQALLQISYGQLRSYQQLAEKLGKPGAVRAVASANANNPISLVIPCHRVIGSDRALRGYAGGIQTKAELLTLEGHAIQSGEITPGSEVLEESDQAVFEL